MSFTSLSTQEKQLINRGQFRQTLETMQNQYYLSKQSFSYLGIKKTQQQSFIRRRYQSDNDYLDQRSQILEDLTHQFCSGSSQPILLPSCAF
mmetsp:Transcript_20120/g.29641  ORF Transcript_20120/g.29641 Transcript_20120/m.29641 type:complete len:92 (-) Transcript_20120:1613-1888(-)